MLFESLNQFNKAKHLLIENGGDVESALGTLKKDPDFKTLSEGQLRLSLAELNEGLGERIINFLGGAFGGDISKIRTVLSQMREQELKFNREEFQIYNEFYSLLQDKKQLEKDKNNPNFSEMSKDISSGMNALNTRMKELTKMHNEIFDALEEKIKGLVGDNKRKKRYFNAQRATDVLETKNDRYEKIKAVTAKSSQRSRDLEEFFGVDIDDTKKQAEAAAAAAQKQVNNLTGGSAPSGSFSYTESPEKELHQRLETIRGTPGGFVALRRDLEKLQYDIEDAILAPEFSTYSEERKKALHNLYLEREKLAKDLERAYVKIT